jgi:hypothetical protein
VTEETNTPDRQEIHARIEFTHEGDSVSISIDAITDEENDAVILAKFIGYNCGPLLHLAKNQREELKAAHKDGFVEANTKHVIDSAARRIVGPDNKPIN